MVDQKKKNARINAATSKMNIEFAYGTALNGMYGKCWVLSIIISCFSLI